MAGGLIHVKADVREFNTWCRKVVEKQTPYAMSRAINEVGSMAVDDVRGELGKTFKIRSSWVAGGIRRQATNKKDKPFIRGVEVGSKDEFMALHAEGGVKVSETGRRVAVPANWLVQNMGRYGVPKALRPKSLLEKDRAFVDEGAAQRGAVAGDQILLRPPKKAGKIFGPQLPPRHAYFLKPRVTIRKRWPFREQVLWAVEREYPKAFRRWMAIALATAK